MKKALKMIISFAMMLVMAFTSYALDIDTIFGVSAHAATYTEKAQSMFEFYKNGSGLDRSKVSSDELYVFGVFVSNFFMPFQTQVGNMSSDAFVNKMCAMFFGDAYTAQQLSDMKYTLGLVQTAQNTRSKMITPEGAPVSLDALYQNFTGFYSNLLIKNESAKNTWMENMNSTILKYTYEGAEDPNSDIVWVSGLTPFDAVLGQLIAVCPTQAGAYMGTAGNSSSSLYVDCFGNISDFNGVIVVPACMNPYSFYNKYLDANRRPKSSTTTGSVCPLQLPINNAFWMGTMVDPRELTLLKQVTDDDGNVSMQLRYGYLALPNLYTALETWTNSATVLCGLSCIDGEELGIYFGSSIATAYIEGWMSVASDTLNGKKLSEIQDEFTKSGPSALVAYPGLIPVFNYVGGTSISITDVLDDIVLFDTYNTFSDSLAESIHVMSMYTDKETGTWWAENPLTGVKSPSIVQVLLDSMADAYNANHGDHPDLVNMQLAGKKLMMSVSKKLLSEEFPKDYTDNNLFIDYVGDKFDEVVLNNLLSTIEQEANTLANVEDLDVLEYFTDGAVYLYTDEPATAESIVSTDGLAKFTSYFRDTITTWQGGSTYNLIAWRTTKDKEDKDFDVNKQRCFAKRLLLALFTGEYTYLFNPGDNGNNANSARLQWCVESIIPSDDMRNGSWAAWDDANDGVAIVGKAIEPPAALTNIGWFGKTSWFAHYTFQKATPFSGTIVEKSSIFATIGAITLGIVSVAAFVVAAVASGGTSVIAAIVSGICAAASLAVSKLCITSVDYVSATGVGTSSLAGFVNLSNTYLANLDVLDIKDMSEFSELKTYAEQAVDHGFGITKYLGETMLVALKFEARELEITGDEGSLSVTGASDDDAAWISGDNQYKYYYAYGHDGVAKNVTPGIVAARKDHDVNGVGDKVCPCGANYAINYSLYGPYKSLASSLGAVSKVYTDQSIVDGDRISKKVGSYITNDVNMWGGVYYAYMVDILGLCFEDDKMIAAQLDTNFPDVSTSMTNKNQLNLQGLLEEGTEEDKEAAEAEKRRTLMDRLDELTDLTSSEYRNKLMTQTTNSWLVSTHNAICGASESGSTQNIGSGSRYQGYSGFVTTSTLSEMPFTSWVMQYYNLIYGVLMVIIIALAICMLISGHRTWRMCLLSVLSMAVILLVPRLTIDTAVSATNNLASSIYRDRFNFWAYSQHLMYLQDLQNSGTELEFLVVTNMQQAKDYYDNENGVTLKWMSPKKSSYWDSIVGAVDIVGADSDYQGLNLSIFTWLFQGQFRQETYSTDPTATYLYRPYLDIVMTASNTPVGSTQRPSFSLSSIDSAVARSAFAAHTQLAWQTAENSLGSDADWDIKPMHRSPTSGIEMQRDGDYSAYIDGLMNNTINDIAYGNYVEQSTSEADLKKYQDAYPKAPGTCISEFLLNNPLDKENIASNLKQFYLYTESPYYYFYYMFKDAANRYSDGSASGLLLSKSYYKYYSAVADTVTKGSNTKHYVDEEKLQDFLNLEDLFTYVIPYLQQANMYSDEWMTLNGHEVTPASDDGFKTNLKCAWQMYSPWVDAMYSTTYAEGKIRSGGKSYKLEDAINPGYYADIRPMVFSPADMQRNFVTDSDLSQVESRIMDVLQNTYTDLMYLNNYTSFDDEVLFSAMAMTATFNFNEEFSNTSLFGEDITLYPVGFEVRNFNYDAFLRLSLLNTTGESIFSDADIYTTVIENTSFFTGILLILNDIVAVYVVPAMKMVVMLALFFLGLLVCMFAFVTPPEGLFKWIAKNYILPFAIFAVTLVAHMLVVSLFVGEGITDIVGQRGITVTTGDPTITIILMLVVNLIYAFLLFQVLRLQLKSFKITLSGLGTAIVGTVAGVGGFIAGRIAAAGTNFAEGNRKTYRTTRGKSKDIDVNPADEGPGREIKSRRGSGDEYTGPQRTKTGKYDQSTSTSPSGTTIAGKGRSESEYPDFAEKQKSKQAYTSGDVEAAKRFNKENETIYTDGLKGKDKMAVNMKAGRIRRRYENASESIEQERIRLAEKNDKKYESAMERAQKKAANAQRSIDKKYEKQRNAIHRAWAYDEISDSEFTERLDKIKSAQDKASQRVAQTNARRQDKYINKSVEREEKAKQRIATRTAKNEFSTAVARQRLMETSHDNTKKVKNGTKHKSKESSRSEQS